MFSILNIWLLLTLSHQVFSVCVLGCFGLWVRKKSHFKLERNKYNYSLQKRHPIETQVPSDPQMTGMIKNSRSFCLSLLPSSASMTFNQWFPSDIKMIASGYWDYILPYFCLAEEREKPLSQSRIKSDWASSGHMTTPYIINAGKSHVLIGFFRLKIYSGDQLPLIYLCVCVRVCVYVFGGRKIPRQNWDSIRKKEDEKWTLGS